MDHTSLSILAVPPEPSLSAYTKYGIQATNTSGPAQEILVFIALASPDQARRFVRPDLGPNRLQRLSADDTRRQKVDTKEVAAELFSL